jgi:hypothetical protein
MPKTRTIVIDQEALEPWAQDIDLIDAALIHHVTIRLSRRAQQHIISPAGIPLVWIHYPTVRAENWLLSIDDRSLQRRFQRLVRLGLLLRRQVSLGREKGSRTYFGVSEKLKARFEEADSGHGKGKLDLTKMSPPKLSTILSTDKIDPTQMSGAYEPPFESGAYDPPKMAAQSLSVSLGMSLSAAEPSYPQSPPQGEASGASPAADCKLKGQEERAAKLQARRKLLAGQAEMLLAEIEAREEKRA